MTEEEVKAIVRITLDELTDRRLIRTTSYKDKLVVVAAYLNRYFFSSDTTVGAALRKYSDDPYIDVIFMQYRDNYTQERIAELLSVDVSTVKRNKKRLINLLYEEVKHYEKG